MNILAISTGAFEEICYLVWKTNQAIVFDPGDDAQRILQALKKHHLEVVAYVCTHAHADHINALAEMHQQRPAPIAIHSNDLKWAFDAVNQIEPYYPIPKQPKIDRYLLLETAEQWTFGDLTCQCIQTPGHTPGSCCLLFPEGDLLISGDTLFKGSCGRTDLPGGDARQLKDSLRILSELPLQTKVYPGHGPDSTIGIEKETNFFMQAT